MTRTKLYISFVCEPLCSGFVCLFVCLQVFSLTHEGELRREEACMDSTGAEGAKVSLMSCHGMKGNQEWTHDRVRHNYYHNTKDFFRIYLFYVQSTSNR